MKALSYTGICIVLFFGLAAGTFAQDCPRDNLISSMEQTTIESFKAVSPLDFSKIKSSGAYLSKDGKKLSVCLSNGDFTIKEMSNDWVSYIKNKEDFILVVKFTNGDAQVVEGEYSASAGYKKPFWVYSEVRIFHGEKGATVSLGVNEGKARIISMKDGKICGDFDLKAKNNTSRAKGEFNTDITVSKW